MPKRYWYVIIVYLIMQLSTYPAALLIAAFFPEHYVQLNIYWLIFSFSLALVIVLLLMRPDMKMPAHRDAATTSGIILWSILGVFLAYFAQVFAASIEMYLLDIEPGSENTMAIMEIARMNAFFIFIPAIIAPILEEIIFRKIIFGSLYKRMNFFFAALLSAFIFAVVHLDFEHLLIYIAMGFVFAFLYVKTKRILVPILVHAGMNSLVVFIQYNLDPEDIEKMLEQLEQMQTVLIGLI